MQVNGNGKLEGMPKVTVAWDVGNQCVHLGYDTDEFKKYEFLSAVLGMAVKEVEAQQRMAQLAMMQQAQAAARQMEGVRGQILRG